MLGIYIDHESGVSITAQLCDQMRNKIRHGELAEGTRLPPSRMLAKEYGIARNIVIDVYEQLIAEGYLTARIGSGTYVAKGIDKDRRIDHTDAWPGARDELPNVEEASFDSARPDNGIIDFVTGVPDLKRFPKKLWAKYMKAAAEDASHSMFDYSDIMGDLSLRTEIAAYLYRTRGMRCHPAQIMIVAGSSEGLFIAAKAFYPTFRAVYMEDPTIDFARDIFHHMNYHITPVDVDMSGMQVQRIECFRPDHLMLLTPSHQFPSGSILAIQRRQLAVKLAAQADSYIIEDDYDGDFRLKGVPIPPLFNLDPSRVLYLGTFSKTLAPGLRLGFIVIPSRLVDRLAAVKEAFNLRVPSLGQAALARFMQEGRLDRHIHRMKLIYRNRRQLLVDAIKKYFGEHAAVRGDEAGMHMLVEFPAEYQVDWQRCIEYGVRIYAVDDYYMGNTANNGSKILFGYGNVSEEDIEEGVRRLYEWVMAQFGGRG